MYTHNISESVAANNIKLPQVLQAILVLIGAGHFASAQAEDTTKSAKPACMKLNAALMNKAPLNGDTRLRQLRLSKTA